MTGYTLEGGVLRVSAAGNVRGAELCDAFGVALAHPELPARPRVLLDLRDAPSLSLSESEIRQLRAIAHAAGLGARGARIAWTALSPLGFGLGRMFEALAELDVQVFRDADEAEKWLATGERAPACA